MMNFRVLKNNLVEILGDAAAGRFRVVGYKQQGSGAEEFVGPKRRVQVVFKGYDIPAGENSETSDCVNGDPEYEIILHVSAPAQGDLTIINNPASSAELLSSALDQFQDASEVADESIDEFFELVYQILMDARNRDLCTDGLPYIVSGRWISSMTKDDPLNGGDHVVLVGKIQMDVSTIENIVGDLGKNAGAGAIDITNDIDQDTNEKTGSISG